MDTTLVTALRSVLGQETGQSVELIETHLSWVLLTPVHAYKLKKPVHLPFVDFGSVQARQYFCEEELRLNRRFAPMLYLDVLPVRGSQLAPRLGGANSGPPIDHVVRMRRFAQASLMRNLLLAGRLEPAWLDGLAQRLATWHATAAASPSPAWASPQRIVRSVSDVLTSLRTQRNDPRLARLQEWLEAEGRALHGTWTARQRTGAVRECHGDLHMGNVVLIEGALVPFDSIEFDPGLRWIDVMSDVAFLTMDLKAHGRPDLAARFLDAWLQRSGDHAGLRVLRFYEIYRALVRAMTGGMGPQSPDATPRPDYLSLAMEWATSTQPGPRLLITHGLSGSGKSTVASQLMQAVGAVRIRSDVERKRQFGLDALECSAKLGIDIYTPQATIDTFESLLQRTRDALQAGYPVIVDAAFLQGDWRRRFQALAAELGVPFLILDCRAHPDTLRQRVATRHAACADASEADVDVLKRQLENRQPLAPDEQACAIVVSTDGAVAIDAVAAQWRAAVAGGPRPGVAGAQLFTR